MAIDPITAGIDLVSAVVSRVWPDATETDKQKAALALAELQAQTDINKIEAAHRSLFVAGWRPMVGWICAFALAYCAILEPIMRFVVMVMFEYMGDFPVIDSDITMQILLGLLGLGGMRTFEKVKKVTK